MRRGNKYGAKKAECQHGHTHDSQREAKRCNELSLLERAGEISFLVQQPHFSFIIDGKPLKGKNGHHLGFTGDFRYMTADHRDTVEDSKGFVVRDYPLRSALFRALYPDIELREV